MRRAGGAQDSSLALEMGNEWNSSPILVTVLVMNFGMLELEISIVTWDFNTPISPYSIKDEVEGQKSEAVPVCSGLHFFPSIPPIHSSWLPAAPSHPYLEKPSPLLEATGG